MTVLPACEGPTAAHLWRRHVRTRCGGPECGRSLNEGQFGEVFDFCHGPLLGRTHIQHNDTRPRFSGPLLACRWRPSRATE
jgi:hypothetical protein